MTVQLRTKKRNRIPTVTSLLATMCRDVYCGEQCACGRATCSMCVYGVRAKDILPSKKRGRTCKVCVENHTQQTACTARRKQYVHATRKYMYRYIWLLCVLELATCTTCCCMEKAWGRCPAASPARGGRQVCESLEECACGKLMVASIARHGHLKTLEV